MNYRREKIIIKAFDSLKYGSETRTSAPLEARGANPRLAYDRPLNMPASMTKPLGGDPEDGKVPAFPQVPIRR